MLGHGVGLQQHQIHVPLLVKYPRAQPGDARVVHSLVSSVDLLPTILDVAGASVPDAVDGVSLRALGERPSSRPVIAESFAVPDGGRQPGADAPSECALFEGATKAVRDASGGVSVFEVSPGREPRRVNLSPAASDGWTARFQALLLSGGQGRRPGSVTSPERDILRSLGYIGR